MCVGDIASARIYLCGHDPVVYLLLMLFLVVPSPIKSKEFIKKKGENRRKKKEGKEIT